MAKKKKKMITKKREIEILRKEIKSYKTRLLSITSESNEWNCECIAGRRENADLKRQVYRLEEERLEFLENWYDLSSDILSEQKARNHKEKKQWTVTINTPENMGSSRNDIKES